MEKLTQGLEERLEKSLAINERLAELLARAVTNQERWAPFFEQQHLENKADHISVLKKLDKLIKGLL